MKFWLDLAVDTLRAPKATATRIMDWNIGRTELYMALIAVSAINAFLAGVSGVLSPAPTDPAAVQAVPMLAVLERPLALFVLIGGGLVVTVHALFWAGRAMGGTGTLTDMLVLLTWLQALRAAAQAVVLVLSLAVPLFAGLVALGVVAVAFWLLLEFISAALRLGSLFRALGVLVAVMAGLLIGLMLLLTLTGVTAGGLTNV
jgi:hypothetical protein